MASQPPAFQFYPADWLAGTARMSLAEKGAYIDALAHQWHADEGIPDNPTEFARVIRATPAEARKVWPAVAKKFTETPDGLRNQRLEEVRAGLREHQDGASKRGRAGADARWAKHRKDDASAMPKHETGIAQAMPKNGSSSSSSSTASSKNDDAARVRASSSGFTSPADFERLSRTHRYVGARLRVPHVLHREFQTKLGGENPDGALMAWYAGLDADLEISRAPVPDVFAYLRPLFVQWAQKAAGEAAMAAWVAEGNRGA